MSTLKAVLFGSTFILTTNGQLVPHPPGFLETLSPDAPFCDFYGRDASYIEEIVYDVNLTNDEFDDNVVRRTFSSGCPRHKAFCLKPFCDKVAEWEGKTDAIVRNRSLDIPAYPCFADEPYETKCAMGPLGITLEGTTLFGFFGRPPCLDANVYEAYTYDGCGGHATDKGEYHYHTVPTCLLDDLNDTLTPSPNGHSPQIGWAYDGFPVHGPHGLDGGLIYPCGHHMADPEDCLDECNGHRQHTVDGFKYHYHVSGPIGDLKSMPVTPYPDTSWSPYTIGCFKGVTIKGVRGMPYNRTCSNETGYVDDYVPVAMKGITHVYNREFTRKPTSMPTETPVEVPLATDSQPKSQSAICIPSIYLILFVFALILN